LRRLDKDLSIESGKKERKKMYTLFQTPSDFGMAASVLVVVALPNGTTVDEGIFEEVEVEVVGKDPMVCLLIIPKVGPGRATPSPDIARPPPPPLPPSA
jgi:hypothetical protein